MELETRTVSRILGEWQIDLVDAGGLSLDGGSMFGSVPRSLWQRLIAPDDKHRIPLAMRLLLIRHRSGGPQILVDVGIGDKFDSKFRDRFAVHDPIGGNGPPITRALSNFGVHPDEITHVILTHLHFDHGGGISTIDRSNELVPTFAGATHYIQRANLATAKDPNPREKASYLRENVEPLDTVQLEQVDGDAELFPGVSVIRSDGHTTGMQVVRLESDGRVIYFPADLAPTQHHVPIPFTMGYDLSAREIMAEKAKVWRRAVEEEAVVVFEHDTQIAAGQLQEDGDRYRLSAAIDFQ